MAPATTIGAAARFGSRILVEAVPDAVLDEARKCLVDWFGVCMAGARQLEGAALAAAVAATAASPGPGVARLLTGGWAGEADAALCQGILSHVLDFDDTHVPSILHGSGPLWAALLAVGESRRIPDRRLLTAFVVGLQVGARLGDGGFGERLTRQGWHATPMLGRLAAGAALAHACGLDALRSAHAIALAGSQTGGLTTSFGTFAKPLNAGRTASDAVLALRLAEAGLEGPGWLLDRHDGLPQTMLQAPDLRITRDVDAFAAMPWEVTRNSFKPYASCQLTHATIDAARSLALDDAGERIEKVTLAVHPLAIRIADRSVVRTPNDARFSLQFCAALALGGRPCSVDDFTPASIDDPRVQALAARVVPVRDDSASRTSARIRVHTGDGRVLEAATAHAFGSEANPMGWPALSEKFLALTRPDLGDAADGLLAALRRFGTDGSLADALALLPDIRSGRPG